MTSPMTCDFGLAQVDGVALERRPVLHPFCPILYSHFWKNKFISPHPFASNSRGQSPRSSHSSLEKKLRLRINSERLVRSPPFLLYITVPLSMVFLSSLRTLSTPSFTTSLFRRNFTSTFVKMVQVERITPGDGQNFPKAGDTVTMHYTGTLAASGKEFDSSRKPGRGPFQTAIGVGQVIQGWDEGVPQLSLGERAKLIIPAKEGYGARGAGEVIPPNADLIFDVELLAINGKKGKY